MESLEDTLKAYKRVRRRSVLSVTVALIVAAIAIGATIVVTRQLRGEIAENRQILNDLKSVGSERRANRFENNTIVIGGKTFLEQDILCEIMARVVERDNPDIVVERSYHESTNANYLELQLGLIDLYAEYTGTIISELLGIPKDKGRRMNAALLNEHLLNRNLVLLKPLGFENSYVLVMLRQRAEELGIQAISDLAAHPNTLAFRSTNEFEKRGLDGLRALSTHYGLQFAGRDIVLEENIYAALREGHVDVTTGFSTDPDLRSRDMVVLADDKEFFPRYAAVPLAHKDLLVRFPGIRQSLVQLSGEIDKEAVVALIQQGREKGLHLERDPEALKRALGPIVDAFLAKKWPERYGNYPARDL